MLVLGLPLWAWWVIGSIALVLVDLSLMGAQFILVPTALAALLAAAVAWAGGALAEQVWSFAGATLVLTPFLVWLLRHRLRRPGPREDGWAVGREVTVEASGTRLVARCKSDTYPFRTTDGSRPAVGDTLVVDRLEGITLYVHKPASEGEPS